MNSGCWYYSFKGTLPPHIKSIAIPSFEDNTAEFELSQIVTEQIKLGFIKEHILELVEKDGAHSILFGTLESISDKPIVYSESETGESVDEYRVTINVKVEWKDLVEDKQVFQKSISGYSEYDPTGASEATREKAIEQAIDNITEDIINAILADW